MRARFWIDQEYGASYKRDVGKLRETKAEIYSVVNFEPT